MYGCLEWTLRRHSPFPCERFLRPTWRLMNGRSSVRGCWQHTHSVASAENVCTLRESPRVFACIFQRICHPATSFWTASSSGTGVHVENILLICAPSPFHPCLTRTVVFDFKNSNLILKILIEKVEIILRLRLYFDSLLIERKGNKHKIPVHLINESCNLNNFMLKYHNFHKLRKLIVDHLRKCINCNVVAYCSFKYIGS